MRRSAAADLGRGEIEARCATAGLTYVGEETEHIMQDTDIHDTQGAVKLSAEPSGALFVPVRLKGDRTSGKLLFMTPEECNHGVTICRECALSWEIDYEVGYASTEAGRELSRQRADTALPHGYQPAVE